VTILQRLLLLALAGGLGAVSRYGLSGLVQRYSGSTFPWGTLAVNVLGCFVFGVIWAVATERMALSPDARIIILTGFLGSFTTFATFMSESYRLLADAEWMLAFANLGVTYVTGLGVFILGLAIGKAI